VVGVAGVAGAGAGADPGAGTGLAPGAGLATGAGAAPAGYPPVLGPEAGYAPGADGLDPLVMPFGLSHGSIPGMGAV